MDVTTKGQRRSTTPGAGNYQSNPKILQAEVGPTYLRILGKTKLASCLMTKKMEKTTKKKGRKKKNST